MILGARRLCRRAFIDFNILRKIIISASRFKSLPTRGGEAKTLAYSRTFLNKTLTLNTWLSMGLNSQLANDNRKNGFRN